MQSPVVGGVVRRLTNLRRLRQRTLAQGNHFEFLWLLFNGPFFLVALNMEDEVTSLLGLCGGVNHKLAVLLQPLQPMLDVTGGLIDGLVVDFTVTGEER